MTYGPIIRIALRYGVGAAIMGNQQLGEALAADPDVVTMCAAGVCFVVEGGYALAKRKGWAT